MYVIKVRSILLLFITQESGEIFARHARTSAAAPPATFYEHRNQIIIMIGQLQII